jgi:hypothetical protein
LSWRGKNGDKVQGKVSKEITNWKNTKAAEKQIRQNMLWPTADNIRGYHLNMQSVGFHTLWWKETAPYWSLRLCSQAKKDSLESNFRQTLLSQKQQMYITSIFDIDSICVKNHENSSIKEHKTNQKDNSLVIWEQNKPPHQELDYKPQ